MRAVKKDVLELHTRQMIYQYISTHPGTYLREIVNVLGMSIGSVEYHLNYLKDRNIVTCISEGKEKRYYLTNIDAKHKRLLAILGNDTRIKIVLFILQNNNLATHKEILTELKLKPSTLSFHLKKLIKKNILSLKPYGENKGYSVNTPSEIIDVVIRYEQHKDIINNFIELWDKFG